MIKIDAHQEVEEIVHQIDAFIGHLPEPLKSLGGEFASTGYPYRTAFLNNDLAFPGLLLPFWVAQKYETHVPDPVLFLERVQKIVRAALLGYLYIRIQDDIYDHKEGHNPVMLLLANEFIRECFQIDYELFPAHSNFWRYFRTAWLDFSQATAWEIKNCRGKIRPLVADELLMEGKKLAFAKVPVAAVLLMANQEQDLPCLSRIIDLLATSSQLLNDFGSLERDLKTQHFTHPLSQSLEFEDANSSANLGDVFFERLLRKTSLEDLFQKVVELDDRVLRLLESFSLPSLVLFLEGRTREVKEIRERYLKLKLQSLLGVGRGDAVSIEH
ncbi:MAG: class 1 isoprenoid biosynthesis enzyme [Chlamydiae bacterium]|nr:class 1 isoprenoid biosynthesis enzyme [Chlamydiota bacterium]MBI3277223.1 class 1 isoprenoid biosynthesis enzyme [Chlamydiota bacterium]